MLDLNLTEKQFEDDIEYSLLTYGGYTKGDAKVLIVQSRLMWLR